MKSSIMSGTLALTLLLGALSIVYGGSATWNLHPTSGDWNTAINWTPATVPNGPDDIATFAISSTLTLGPTVATQVNSIVFPSGARPYIIQPTTGSLTISGAGITNNSSFLQQFVSGLDSGPIILSNSANAGSNLAFVTFASAATGGRVQFTDSASAGANTYRNEGAAGTGIAGGITEFFDNTTAATSIITNDSGINILNLGGLTIFHNNSTAANATFINNAGVPISYPGEVDFLDASTAANATFTNNGEIKFEDSATAGNAVITLGDNEGNFGAIEFSGDSTAGNATITLANGGIDFSNAASAGTSTISNSAIGGASILFNPGTTLDHATLISNGATRYYLNSTAGSGNITINAPGNFYCNDADSCTMTLNGASSDSDGAVAYFGGNAGNSSFTVNGASAVGDNAAALLDFYGGANADTSTIVANGGMNGGLGGTVRFSANSDGGTARIELLGNSQMQLTTFRRLPLNVGSIEGEGLVLLEGKPIVIGGNNLSTEFSGIIEDSPDGTILGGQVSKTGTGTLTLTGSSTYTGGTTINGGTVAVNNTAGSGTGTGAVNVNAGTLGGKGTIAGAVTVGTGSGAGAFLEPSIGMLKTTSLSIQSGLTFKADSTYTYKLNTNRVKADKVNANGVTIDSGAQFNFVAFANKTLRVGKVFVVISNTAATPISGTFANLPDGSTITVGSNTFQASYEGGDGNDLTLTVVP